MTSDQFDPLLQAAINADPYHNKIFNELYGKMYPKADRFLKLHLKPKTTPVQFLEHRKLLSAIQITEHFLKDRRAVIEHELKEKIKAQKTTL